VREPADRSSPELSKLRKLRGNPAMVCFGLIDHDTPPQVYELLRGTTRMPRLDLVLITQGGLAAAARRLALLLHEYTERLTILVPHRAWSAGTLLCLAANELVLGPMAELGPLDPRIGAVRGSELRGDLLEGTGPGVVSAEDIRAFRELAREWFGVDDPASRVQVLGLLSQRVSPVSLGGFFRADRLVRQIAAELLAFQLPDAAGRAELVDRLVSGYHAHDHAITRSQARSLGLRVTDADADEESLLWDIAQRCRSDLERSDGVRGLVLADLAAPPTAQSGSDTARF
jgi:hypothetical protein